MDIFFGGCISLIALTIGVMWGREIERSKIDEQLDVIMYTLSRMEKENEKDEFEEEQRK